jgi:hypothetical protein
VGCTGWPLSRPFGRKGRWSFGTWDQVVAWPRQRSFRAGSGAPLPNLPQRGKRHSCTPRAFAAAVSYHSVVTVDLDFVFARYNLTGAHVDQVEGTERASFGTCDQVRVMRWVSPTNFYMCWWSPWPEEDPRALHNIHVVAVRADDDVTLILEGHDGVLWEFSDAEGEFAKSVRDYHRQKTTDPADPAYYAALEARSVAAAQDLFD